MVILVILAILAAIIVPAMTGWIEKAKKGRLLVACRTCVTAAQTLANETYAMDGKVTIPSNDAVLALAGVKGGTVIGTVIGNEGITDAKDANRTAVTLLTYREDGEYCTYFREPNPHYAFSKGQQFETGLTFAIGDLMTSNGYVFQCIRANITGTTSRTRDPSLRSNKSTWRVIGYTGDPLPYSSTVRYAAGLRVEHKGKIFERTDFNLVGGQVPYDDPPKDSDYWTYIGPATP